MSIDRWMDKEYVVHTYNGISLNCKKKIIIITMPFDGPGNYHTSKVREGQIMWCHLCVESLKMIQINLFTKQK